MTEPLNSVIFPDRLRGFYWRLSPLILREHPLLVRFFCSICPLPITIDGLRKDSVSHNGAELSERPVKVNLTDPETRDRRQTETNAIADPWAE